MTASLQLRLLVVALTSLAAGGALAGPVRGVTNNEIIIGLTAGFSSTSREIANSTKVGIEVAMAEINAAGGVADRKLRLVGADHGNNPAKAVELLKDLTDQKNVFLLTGNTASGAVEKQLPYILQMRVMLFGSYSGGEFMYNEPPDRYIFNFRPAYSQEIAQTVRYLVVERQIKASEIAFFGQEDSFGDGCWKGFSKAIRRNKGDPRRAVRVGYKTNSMDVEQAVRTIRAARLKAVVTCGTHKQVAAFIAKVNDLKLTLTAVSAVDSTALAEDLLQLGPDFADGVIVTQVVPMPTSSSTAVMRYREQLKKYAPSSQPDYVSLQSYLSTLVLIEGLRHAGQDLNTETLVEALEGLRNWDMGLGAAISFGPSQHTASRMVWGTVLSKDGTYKSLDLEVD